MSLSKKSSSADATTENSGAPGSKDEPKKANPTLERCGQSGGTSKTGQLKVFGGKGFPDS